MRIAVVGGGVSGLVAARLLQEQHDVSLFEVEGRAGGHSHTVDVPAGPCGEQVAVDTGFIVFNRHTYPLFCNLLEHLGIRPVDSDMGFSVQMEASGVEYCGRGLGGLFAQRRNLLRRDHWRMLRDLLRFMKQAPRHLDGDGNECLGDWLAKHGYSDAFIDAHLVPMAAAVWSADPSQVLTMPARTLFRFFDNHGFLKVRERPQWLTIPGGSRTYVQALLADFHGEVLLDRGVSSLTRLAHGVRLCCTDGTEREFDQVVLATHGDTALQLLDDPSALESEILGCFRFQPNEVLLHQDASILPRTERVWSAWNYFVPEAPSESATVTYWMNRLQDLETPDPLLVTLNRSADIDPSKVLRRFVYDHPIFDAEAIAAQGRHREISGVDRIHYCGAWWRYGFHEDGVWSAWRVAQSLGASGRILGRSMGAREHAVA